MDQRRRPLVVGMTSARVERHHGPRVRRRARGQVGRRVENVVTPVVVPLTIVALVWSDLRDGTWRWLVPSMIALSFGVWHSLDLLRRRFPASWVPGLLLGVTAISYLCVPETDQIPEVAYFILAIALLEIARGPFGRGILFVASAVVLWAGIYGATGRESALLGALFAWWPFLIVPALITVRGRIRTIRRRWFVLVVFVAAVAASIVARTGALQPTARPAVRAIAIALPLSGLVVVVIALVSVWLDGRRAARRLPTSG